MKIKIKEAFKNWYIKRFYSFDDKDKKLLLLVLLLEIGGLLVPFIGFISLTFTEAPSLVRICIGGTIGCFFGDRLYSFIHGGYVQGYRDGLAENLVDEGKMAEDLREIIQKNLPPGITVAVSPQKKIIN